MRELTWHWSCKRCWESSIWHHLYLQQSISHQVLSLVIFGLYEQPPRELFEGNNARLEVHVKVSTDRWGSGGWRGYNIDDMTVLKLHIYFRLWDLSSKCEKPCFSLYFWGYVHHKLVLLYKTLYGIEKCYSSKSILVCIICYSYVVTDVGYVILNLKILTADL